MIWPGRCRPSRLVGPRLAFPGAVRPPTPWDRRSLRLNLLVGPVAVVDLFTLIGAGAFRAERRCGTVKLVGRSPASRAQPPSTWGGSGGFSARDDVPDVFVPRTLRTSSSAASRRAGKPHSSTPSSPNEEEPTRFIVWMPWFRADSDSGNARSPGLSRRSYGSTPIFARLVATPCSPKRDKLSTMGVRRTRRLGTDNESRTPARLYGRDEPRHMDWRATGAARKLTVRHPPGQPESTLDLLDRLRPNDGRRYGAGASPLDHALNSMLMLAHIALIRGDQVGMIAFSDRVLAYVPPSGGAKRVKRLVHSVHNIFPELVESRYDRVFVELEKPLAASGRWSSS